VELLSVLTQEKARLLSGKHLLACITSLLELVILLSMAKRLNQGDTFCIPTWNRYEHSATGSEDVYLYRFDDQPMTKVLGFYRTDQTDIESLVA